MESKNRCCESSTIVQKWTSRTVEFLRSKRAPTSMSDRCILIFIFDKARLTIACSHGALGMKLSHKSIKISKNSATVSFKDSNKAKSIAFLLRFRFLLSLEKSFRTRDNDDDIMIIDKKISGTVRNNASRSESISFAILLSCKRKKLHLLFEWMKANTSLCFPSSILILSLRS